MIRIVRVGTGLTLVMLGVFLLVLPGPGLLTIAGGLAILAVDFAWARNLLDWMKSRFREHFTNRETSAARDGATDESVS
ncbi:MAG: PGPGW domain-containing protein [Actinomycetota bacterium]